MKKPRKRRKSNLIRFFHGFLGDESDFDFLKIETKKNGFLGYSLGARIALAEVCRQPDAIDFLILESGTPGIRNTGEREKRRASDQLWAERFRAEPRERVLADWFDQPIFGSLKNHPKFPELFRSRLCASAEDLMKYSQGVMPPMWQNLPKIKVPVLLLVGEKDEKYRRIADQMHELLPDSQIDIIPNAGHNTHFEQPKRFALAVTTFLGRLKRK
jgi:2-succinyl-6-hydroxy-2,4-cyclohexadiene-1-carboxylate synthase